MRIYKKPLDLQRYLIRAKKKGRRISFVPTMGALHQGHLSLIKAARKAGDILVISIFVNPVQFGPREDYRRYPRPVNKDKELARQNGVDVLFYPPVKNIYPDNYSTYVSEERLSKVLCGRSRPGHFRGVTTVVLKLFNIVQPDISFFGQKDFQQAVIIKKMIKDLNMPTKIKILPTVREKNGLALSSRNRYLSAAEYSQALSLYKALKLVARTQRPARGRAYIRRNKLVNLEYLKAVDGNNLKPVTRIRPGVVLVIAAMVGKTRLIDNLMVKK